MANWDRLKGETYIVKGLQGVEGQYEQWPLLGETCIVKGLQVVKFQPPMFVRSNVSEDP